MDYIVTAIVVVVIIVLATVIAAVAVFALLGLGWILAPLIHFSSDQRARYRTIDEASATMKKTSKRS